MRLQKLPGKTLLVPGMGIPCSQFPRHIRVSRAVRNLLFYHHYLYSRFCLENRSKLPLNHRGEKTELYTLISQNFNAIRSALETCQVEKSLKRDKQKGLNDYAYALYSLASPTLIERYLFALASRSLSKYRSTYSQNSSGDKVVKNSPKRFSEAISEIVLAYGRFFYDGKTTTETDIRFLNTLDALGLQNNYLQFAKDVLAACLFNTLSETPEKKVAAFHLQKQCQHPSFLSKHVVNRKKTLAPSNVTKILGLVSKNVFLYDQKLIASMCTALQRCFEISRDARNSRFKNRHLIYPLTSFEAYQCILALYKMRHFNRALRDGLVYMTSLPQQRQPTHRSTDSKHNVLDINHFIEALAIVVPYKDLIDANDFLHFLGRIFWDKEYIQAKAASRLLSIVSMREIQNIYPSDNAQECGSNDQNSLPVVHPPRFHSRGAEDSEISFTLQNENTNIIPSVLSIIDSIILKHLPQMKILDVCRVVQGMVSDYTCIGSSFVWSALLRRIDKLYSAKSRILHKGQERLLLGNSSQDGKDFIVKRKSFSIQRKVIVAAHATLLALLPRIEMRQACMLEEEQEKIEVDLRILGKIARCIPCDSLEKNSRKFADIILVIRRAFCDFPQLYEIDSRLWEIVKSARVSDRKRSAKKLYRSSRRHFGKQRDVNGKLNLQKESAELKIRKPAHLDRYRRKNILDCYRPQLPIPGVHRFK